MCNSKAKTVCLHLRVLNAEGAYITGEDADGNQHSFEKKSISYVLNTKQDSARVVVDRKLIGLIKPPRGERAPSVETAQPKRKKSCLNCKHTFMADPVIFICDPCKKTVNWRAGGDYSFAK